ncbi:hypothetical protein [Glycomyces buryatensis]|nr:hypothetical protein [Glycomyces buryatensis]
MSRIEKAVLGPLRERGMAKRAIGGRAYWIKGRPMGSAGTPVDD